MNGFVRNLFFFPLQLRSGLALALLLTGALAQAQIFQGTTGDIPDDECPDLTPFTADVTLTGEIGDEHELYYVQINIDHTWSGDLDIYLTSPSGTSLELTTDNGFGANYYNTRFQDGELPITSGMSPFEGKFQAEGGSIAAAFDGEPVNGTWKLEICDDVRTDKGAVIAWSLGFIPPMRNDICQRATELPCGTTVNASNDLLTIVDSPPTCFEEIGQGAWYTIQGNGEIGVLSTDNPDTDFDTRISVYISPDGCEGNFTCVLSDDNGGTGNTSFLHGITQPGLTYYIYVDGADGATGNYELTYTCHPVPEAVCQDFGLILGPLGEGTVYPSDIDGGSTPGYEAITLTTSGQATFYCDDVEVPQSVRLVATDGLGYADSCDAGVTVAIGDTLLPGWTGLNVGYTPGGSTFAYNPCTSNNPERGEFTITTTAFNQPDLTEDNYAYITRTLCGRTGLQVELNTVEPSSNLGLMIRASNDPSDIYASFTANLTSIFRWQERFVFEGDRNVLFYGGFPEDSERVLMRLWRSPNHNVVRGALRFGSNPFAPIHAVELDLPECVEIGMALFSANDQVTAEGVLSNLRFIGEEPANEHQSEAPSLTQETLDTWDAEWERARAAQVPMPQQVVEGTAASSFRAYPNPARGLLQVQLERPLSAEAQLLMVNTYGQLVRAQQLNAGQGHAELDLKGLAPGMYWLKLGNHLQRISVQ
ncbi:MAG: proprotein convertase P-domain-containing protein [bacterium]|nr:proprotein convertase P-domain-containing protein [bacterium]